jgi:hypothetical protein
MSDLTAKLQAALDKAAEFELIGSLAADPRKRAEYRTLAAFQYSIAHELRFLMATGTDPQAQPPHAHTDKIAEDRKA